MKWNEVLTVYAVSLIAAGCGTVIPDRVGEALALAGENRHELERVLVHYSGDSLRLEAARHLIGYMPGHYSYRDRESASEYYSRADSLLRSLRGSGRETIAGALDSLAVEYAGRDGLRTAVQDVEIMTAGFLIDNIDRAFECWENLPWCTNIGFEDFCELLLPYKAQELQPFTDWRESLRGRYSEGIKWIEYCDIYRVSPLRAAIAVNSALRDSISPEIGRFSFRLPVLDPAVRRNVPYGTCEDLSALTVSVMRAEGIPVALEHTPQWAFRSMGHSWDAVPDVTGRFFPFSGCESTPGDAHKIDEKMGKAYRTTYAPDPGLERLLGSGTFVPPEFRSPFMKDVTASHVACGDVSVNVPGVKGGYVYLAVFDDSGWSPVAYSEIKDSRADFNDMGKGCLYIPVMYSPEGRQVNAGPPFILGVDGGTRTLEPDTSVTVPVELYRKYPVQSYVSDRSVRMIGGEFQASDSEDFSHPVAVHTISDGIARGHEVTVGDSVGPHRFWRYIQHAENTFCNVAEIVFVGKDSGREIRGRVIGTPGSLEDSPDYVKEKAFDGDLLTNYEAPEGQHCWLGMDFGSPVGISRILYTSRGDGNSIEMGDTYELFYYGDGAWVSLGMKTADNVMLRYDGVPANALLLLRDRTRGRDERIFTYENGEQVWW